MATIWIVCFFSCVFFTSSLYTDLNKIEWGSDQIYMHEQILKLQQEVEQLREDNKQIRQDSKEIRELLTKTKNISRSCNRTPFDCSDIYKNGERKTGIYTIYPFGENSNGLSVLCRMDSHLGVRTVVQYRGNPHMNFNVTWEDYKRGFGDVRDAYWLGNDAIHELTTTFQYDLHVYINAQFNVFTYGVKYSSFSISAETDGYRLSLGKQSGNLTDAFRDPNTCIVNQPFFTFDHDNEHKCANRMASGWWFNNCAAANLNAPKFGNLSFPVWLPLIESGSRLYYSQMTIGRH
ncbi:microfibril-associated glycoprotein 4-like isoform X3 [Saccostrea cucullata]|uniref:microfibril-associated glycoprotein 4-like isoform X3 n=1 Tax=Saccostrea cuccullata TaxID=36930 RepID=UPI002ECFD92E